MFDPTYPPANADLESAPLRAQFNGLKDLIDAVSGVTSAVVDRVDTLPAGDAATVEVGVSGTVLHLSFGIPQGVVGPAGSNGQNGTDGQNGQNGSDGADGAPGPPGAQGPPFATAVVESVNTLGSGEMAVVTAVLVGQEVRFTFGIPRGADGADGAPGAPGEVTQAELAAAVGTAVAGSSANSNHVGTLNQQADGNYNFSQLQQVMDKLDELISALRR